MIKVYAAKEEKRQLFRDVLDEKIELFRATVFESCDLNEHTNLKTMSIDFFLRMVNANDRIILADVGEKEVKK